MKRRTGFTLVEALVVVAAVVVAGLALAVSVGGCGRGSRDLRYRAECRSNLRCIGQAIGVYCGNSTAGDWPFFKADWSGANATPTGTNRTVAPFANDTTTYNVSALLFLLLRDGCAPGIYVCPSTQDTLEPHPMTPREGVSYYNWDFSPFQDGQAEHVSYSYQAPLRTTTGTSESWTSGVTPSSDAGLPILADRTHFYGAYNKEVGNWSSLAKPARYMSQNHHGEVINVLYAGLHVSDATRADCGVKNDAIYYAAGNRGASQTGTNSMADHTGPNDSFLVGPVKMP